MNSYNTAEKSAGHPALFCPDFSVFDLQKSIAGLLDLYSISAGREYKKEIARAAVNLLNRTSKIDPHRQQMIYDEIEQLNGNEGNSDHAE